jgi:F-type H+-transporting ATPase subunit epsilon
MEIQSAKSVERFTDIVGFQGRDSSGAFGVLANAERRMTVLSFGLHSFRYQDHTVEYLALPGGLLYFRDNELLITTQNYVRDRDMKTITLSLQKEIHASEAALQDTKRSLRRLDDEIIRRLSRLGSDLAI